MLDKLTERLSKIIGGGKLSQGNIKAALKQVEKSLLEADVAKVVVEHLLEEIQAHALGMEIPKHYTAAQAFVKLVSEKLTDVMGQACEHLNLASQPPAIVLMAGLQGSGKTTTAAKLAKRLMEREKKRVMLVSTDVYRPAAIEQLQVLAEQIGALFFDAQGDTNPLSIAQKALAFAKTQFKIDVLIIDSAGRSQLDEAMMQEISQIHQQLQPIETLFVVDGMMGQEAAKTAQAFNARLALTGIIVTKLDGDARGGAMLSIRYLTKKPIKFIGMGEKVDNLEAFHPERMASRILGMGDMLSLIEQIDQKVDKDQAERLGKKLSKGTFNLEDFRLQLVQMKEMGGLSNLMDKMPGMGNLPTEVKSQVNDKSLDKMMALINSMTFQERRRPVLLEKGSRKQRIILGSGTNIRDLNNLLKQFDRMQKTMKKVMQKGGMAQMLRSVKGMQNMLPKGNFGNLQ